MTDFSWDPDDNRCFGCGDNPWGLGLEFEEDGEWMKARTSLDKNYGGFEGAAHGGIVATLLDEAASWAVMRETERIAPSFELNCTFKRPVPLGPEIEVRGRVLQVKHEVAFSEAKLIDEKEKLLASGKVKSKLLSSVNS